MKRSGICPKCGSQKIVRGARVGNGDHLLYAWTFGDPDALLFKERVASNLAAYVCSLCGFTELYATAPATLPGATQSVAAPKPAAPKVPKALKPPAPPGGPERLPKPPPGKLPKRPPNKS